MKHIKAILFDLDGTLRHSIPQGTDIFIDHARSLGLNISEQDAITGLRWEHYYWASSPELDDDLKIHDSNTPEFWTNYNKRQLTAFGINPANAQELAPVLSKFMRENYKHESTVHEDVFRALTHFKETGYRLGVVSNRETPFTEELDQLKLSHYFEFALAGGEVNSYKPDREIFDAALGKVGMQASETMYVGDNFFADVIGSHRAGLVPVLYDPRGLFPEAQCAVIRSFDELIQLF
jgi:HAD superfamily hydrolase (TIGR01549 family)